MGSVALLGLFFAAIVFMASVGLYILAGCIQIVLYTFFGVRWCCLKLVHIVRSE